MTIKYYYSSDSSSFGVSRKLKYCIIRPNLTEYSDPLLLCSESICAESSVPLTHFVTNPFPPICFSATSFLCDDKTSLWNPILLCSNVLSGPVLSVLCPSISSHTSYLLTCPPILRPLSLSLTPVTNSFFIYKLPSLATTSHSLTTTSFPYLLFLADRRGVVSMANNGPNTNGCQFFLIYSAQPHLNNMYTIFGQVRGRVKCE